MIPTAEILVGPAGQLRDIYTKKITNGLKKPLALLLYGTKGVGKTVLSYHIASQVAGHETNIEHINGRNVNADVVRRWIEEQSSRPLFGKAIVKMIDEVDLCTTSAQDLLLTWLDRMTMFNGIVATSNLNVKDLTERFSSRFMQVLVGSPSPQDVVHIIMNRYPISRDIAESIVYSGIKPGHETLDVRAALNDAETAHDIMTLS